MTQTPDITPEAVDYKGPSNIGTTRWNPQLEQYYKGESTKPSYRPTMTPDITGRYVLARDYAALSDCIEKLEAKLAAAELVARVLGEPT
jgi:hypothetical protein